MLRRAACVGLLGALAGCSTDVVTLHDLWDASISNPNPNPNPDAGPGWGRDERWSGLGCKEQSRSVKFTPQTPELMIVLDRSSTMQTALPGSASKQAAVQSALSDAIGTYQSHINFGLELFPSYENERAGDCRSSCCAADPAVPPQPNTLDAISGFLLCSDQQGCQTSAVDSPSHKALEQVQISYSTRSKTSSWNDNPFTSAYVLLVTSVEPSCSAETSGPEVCQAAKTTAGNLAKLDIPVVVLSVGYSAESNSSSCLVQLSKVGTVSPMPSNVPRLYTASSYNDLKEDLSTLLAPLARKSCTLTTTDFVPDYATPGVGIGDTTIAQDASNGWSFTWSRAQIKLSGSACDQYVKSPQGTSVQMAYTCSTCADASNPCNN